MTEPRVRIITQEGAPISSSGYARVEAFIDGEWRVIPGVIKATSVLTIGGSAVSLEFHEPFFSVEGLLDEESRATLRALLDG